MRATTPMTPTAGPIRETIRIHLVVVAVDVAAGVGAGVAVVIIAIWLDRVSNSLSDRRPRTKKAPTTGSDDADESAEQTEHAEQGAA